MRRDREVGLSGRRGRDQPCPRFLENEECPHYEFMKTVVS
jgi:hypothetical protein